MEAVRDSWTDGRLDDFSHRIDERFDRVDERFDGVDERFRQVDHRFDRVEADSREHRAETRAELVALHAGMNTRFDTTQYMMIRIGAATLVTMLFGFVGLLFD